ncbi:hypothetical protein AVEN_201177-1 [Araneus ventricosus]|uniref:Uncharacterized protein n=1 Tax=Araneus ventricosus TaxID=182803 RepID=A0A4Y2NVZ8_ARAVE|nr:hypothetical protein AVEN_201177-1 [Araneus ventricosus]
MAVMLLSTVPSTLERTAPSFYWLVIFWRVLGYSDKMFGLTTCFRCHEDNNSGLFCPACAVQPSDAWELLKAAVFSFLNEHRSGVIRRVINEEFHDIPETDVGEILDELLLEKFIVKSRHRYYTSMNESRKIVGLSNHIRYSVAKAIDSYPRRVGASVNDIKVALEREDQETPFMLELDYVLRKLEEQHYIFRKSNRKFATTSRAYKF